jgi:hypothetical protein
MRTKKIKPPPKNFEYKLIISKEYDLRLKKDYILFRIQTTKVFLSFQYNLKVETLIKDNKINFSIIGFNAPVSGLASSGNAGFEFPFFDYNIGLYQISIERNDSEKIQINLKIQKSKKNPLLLLNTPKTSFIEIEII